MRSLALRSSLVAIALVAAATPGRADDYAQIEKAKEHISEAGQWIGIGCFDKTEQALKGAEKELAGVDETGKAEHVAKIKELREKIAEYQKNWRADDCKKNVERQISSDEYSAEHNPRDIALSFERSDAQLADSWIKTHLEPAALEELQKKQAWAKKKTMQAGTAEEVRAATGQLGRLMSGVENCVESAKTTTDNAYLKKNFAEQVKNIKKVVAKHEKALGAEKVAEYKKQLATHKADFEKNTGDAMLLDLARTLGMVQEVLDGKRQWTESQVHDWFKEADARAATCPQGDKRTTDAKARLAQQRKDFEKLVATEARDALVKPVLESWKSCKEYGKDTEGWEQESKPNTLQFYMHNSPSKLGCEKTEKLLSEVVQRFFNNDHVAEAQKKYPNDAELKAVIAEASALREKASAKVLTFYGSLVDEAEKLPEGSERKDFMGQFYNLKIGIEHHCKGATGADKMIARLVELEKKWRGDTAAGEASKAEQDKKACESVKAAWPGLASSLIAKAKKISGTEAVANPGAWNGTIVHFSGGARGVNMNRAGWDWFGDWAFVADADGVPVCGNLDPGLLDAVQEVVKRTGIGEDSCEEVIGVVDGTCRITQRVKVFDQYVNGDTVTGIKIRIIGWRAVTVCAVAGEGTNLSKMEGMKEISVGGSSGGGGGGWIHMFAAWGMSFVLVLGGVLAVAYGAAKFVPAIKENLDKLGNGLGYAGVGFAVVGVLWFLGALVFWVIWGQGGSLPSVALLFAGGFVGAVDLLRKKGTLKEETAAMIQPAGILLGLGCFFFALVHFFLWNWTLL